ncbi:hypothetical protein [Acinetobacter sp. ANC 4641]|uniref:hypothetical protein n=1 Tax=Acinetobacter sp. ANC 4641 TaxID=2529847 RepID=UPI001D0DA38B|nr:hypothetical protein [Acinetobacter sp. ANC 4641]
MPMIYFNAFLDRKLLIVALLVSTNTAANQLPSQEQQHHLFSFSNENICRLHNLQPTYLWSLSPLQNVPENTYAPEFDPYSQQLSNELMAVFSQDSLSQKAQKSEQNHRKRRIFGENHTEKAARKKISTDNHWVKHVLSDLSQMLPFQNDMNLGSNSPSDVYVELSAEKNWKLTPKFSFDAAQTFRYGAQSRNYSETNFKLTQQESKTTLASTQFSVVKTFDETYTWDNHLFRQQQFPNDKRLTYGIYSSGIYDKTKRDIELQSWGPYVSWRRPLLYNWIYIENEVSYYKELTSNEGKHVFSTSLQFETNF